MSEIFEAGLRLLLLFSMVIVMLIYTLGIFKNAQSLVAPNRLVRRNGGRGAYDVHISLACARSALYLSIAQNLSEGSEL
jgi:hypothetical protein